MWKSGPSEPALILPKPRAKPRGKSKGRVSPNVEERPFRAASAYRNHKGFSPGGKLDFGWRSAFSAAISLQQESGLFSPRGSPFAPLIAARLRRSRRSRQHAVALCVGAGGAAVRLAGEREGKDEQQGLQVLHLFSVGARVRDGQEESVLAAPELFEIGNSNRRARRGWPPRCFRASSA